MVRLALALLSFLYLILLAFFLAFGALWVCDGYNPVDWGWQGTLIHLGMWLPPAILLTGVVMLSFGAHRKAIAALIFASITPFAIAVFWGELAPTDFGGGHHRFPWMHLLLLAPLLASGAVACTYQWAVSMKRPGIGGVMPQAILVNSPKP